MPEKPWRKSEPDEGTRGRGWINAIVLAALALAVAVVALVVVVPRERWENLWRNLPARWEALRALLQGEDPGRREPLPLASPTPLSTTPVAMPSPGRT